MRLLFILTSLLAFNFALSQACYSELRSALADEGSGQIEGLGQIATGAEAARLLRAAVDLLEPVLPPLVPPPATFTLRPGDEGFEDADFLAQRSLLPAAWQAATLTPDVWREMVDALAAWYGLDAFQPGPELTRATLLETLSNLVAAASARQKPVALIATDPTDRNTVAFWGVIRSDSVYPRLVAHRPPDTATPLAGGVAAALPLLETCAQRLDNFIFASATTAQKLFLATNQARMYVASTAPASDLSFLPVPAGEETDYLTFKSAVLAPYSTFAALFDGPSIGPAALLRLLPQVRTNMNPREVLRLVLPPD